MITRGLVVALLLLCTGAVPAAADLPAGVTVLRDVAYGPAKRHRMDVYLPPEAKAAPVILMVHGGAWRIGDKRHGPVFANKVARWAPLGFIFVVVNYPMLPESDPVAQADDVARALAAAQQAAPGWGGDPDRFILMGHSAGAHLVSLLNADPARALTLGAKPWLGAVSLDSGALDVPAIMQARHPELYDDAFGADPAFWAQASPAHNLTGDSPPWLGVCSGPRRISCAHNRAFAAKAQQLGRRAEVLGRDLSHGAINSALGNPGAYTEAVEAFLASLHPTVRALLEK
jgi:acetyl esterase/lipase